MEQCCRLRYVVAVLVVAEIILVLVTINSIAVDRARKFKTPLSSDSIKDIRAPDTAMNEIVDYDNDTHTTADEFLSNYSIYCEKFLIPYVLNVRHYSRETPLCPCVPADLGLCFVHI